MNKLLLKKDMPNTIDNSSKTNISVAGSILEKEKYRPLPINNTIANESKRLAHYVEKPWLSSYGKSIQSSLLNPSSNQPTEIIYPIKKKNLPKDLQSKTLEIGLEPKLKKNLKFSNKLKLGGGPLAVYDSQNNTIISPYKQGKSGNYGIHAFSDKNTHINEHEWGHANDPILHQAKNKQDRANDFLHKFAGNSTDVQLKRYNKELGMPLPTAEEIKMYKQKGYADDEIAAEVFADSHAKGQLDYVEGKSTEYSNLFKTVKDKQNVKEEFLNPGYKPNNVPKEPLIDPSKRIKSKLQDKYIYKPLKEISENNPELSKKLSNTVKTIGESTVKAIPKALKVAKGLTKGAIGAAAWEGYKKILPEGQGDVISGIEDVVYSIPGLAKLTPLGINNFINSVSELSNSYSKHKKIVHDNDLKDPKRILHRKQKNEMDREKQMWVGYR